MTDVIPDGRDPGDEDDSWVHYRGENFNSEEAKFLSRFDRDFPPIEGTVRRDEIGGLDAVLSQIDVFKRGIEAAGLYEIFGSRPPKGFILQGPPGVGKTLIAKYIATDMGATFVDLPLTKYESKWVGKAASNLTEIIDRGRQYNQLTKRPVLFFFDEAEEAFKDRTLGGWHGPRVNVLLREMDGLGSSSGLMFGAATNHLEKVDSAVLRAGRLDYIITIPEYNSAMMADVFRATATRLNRLAPHHEPFQLGSFGYETLGRIAKAKKLKPSDVGEVFRRAVDAKVEWAMTMPPGTMVRFPDTHIYMDDIAKSLQAYEREDTKKGGIGF